MKDERGQQLGISRKEFLSGNFKTLRYDRTKHPVYKFLKKNKDKAYTGKQLVTLTGLKFNTIMGMLFKLRKDGLVIHDSPFWAIK